MVIQVDNSKIINYAMQQNKLSCIRCIRLSNDTDISYENTFIKITCTPQFAEESVTLVPIIPANGKIEVNDIKLVINGDYLASLTEKCTGSFVISLFNCNPEEENATIIAETTTQIDILPYNQWTGVNIYPHLLTCFSMPNHPSVCAMLPEVANILAKWDKDPSITGYMSNDRNVIKKQIGAIYECIKNEKIAYSLPPASYDTVGQRIRTPEEIQGQKLGTCLDLTMLFSSLLEACRLNPIIILMKDHAFVGCHLEDTTSVECVDEDIASLNKKNADGINEILLIETTCAVAGKNVSFEEAIEAGNANLLNESAFLMSIDVARTRGSRILPLPTRVLENGSYRIIEYDVADNKISKPAKEIVIDNVNVRENVFTKQMLWERKLLDLSMRNPLLNFRVTKSVVQLIAGDLAVIENCLNNGDDFAIYPIPSEVNIIPDQTKIYPYSEYKEVIDAVAQSEFKNRRIRTFLREPELLNSLKNMQRTNKKNIEESGAGTLYLALGALKWYENDVSKKERYSPLIMVPVSLTKKLADKTYHLKLVEEETRVNITLLEFLRQNFGMDIGGLDPLPEDEAGIDISLILNTFRKAVMDKEHWDVCEYAFIGNFSFSRFIMWNDIKNPKLNIEDNKVIKSLIDGGSDWETSVDDAMLQDSDKIKPQELAVVLSADATQLKAVQASALGESFVLHGPPGTGKSQTITNMIANALYNGKRVLFVAEKMAALSVVQNRLEKVGLGSYCLELHSNKAQKSAVLAQLERSLSNMEEDKSEQFESKAESLYSLRCELDAPVDALHEIRPCGFSIYELIGLYEANIAYEGKLNLTRDYVSCVSKQRFEDICVTLEKLSTLNDTCGNISTHPLKDFYVTEYSIDVRRDFEDSLNEYKRALKEAESPFKILRTRITEAIPDTMEGLDWLERLIENLSSDTELLPKLLFGYLAKENYDYYMEKIDEGKQLKEKRAAILDVFKNDIFTYDEIKAKQRFVEAQGKWVLLKNKEIKGLLKEIRFMSTKPEAVSEANLMEWMDRLTDYKACKDIYSKERDFAESFGKLFNGEDSDFKTIEDVLNKAVGMCNILSSFPGEEEGRQAIYTMLRNGELLNYVNEGRQVLRVFMENAVRRLEAENKLIEKYKMDINGYRDVDGYIDYMVNKIDSYLANSEYLREYTYICSSLDIIRNEGILEAVEGLKEGSLEPAELLPSFVASFGRVAAEYYIIGDDRLKAFDGTRMEVNIERLKAVSEEYTELTKAMVASKLAENVYAVGKDVVSKTHIGVLKKAIKSGAKAVPVRKLFEQIPSLINTLCPCMLMSPISVAQYLSPSFPKFDLVIFDEASQLPTSEAIGSMARGKEVIVVGDPKQLPPTSFFETVHEDEETADIEDMESLLDDCLTISMPERYLQWHYRSRHESLIAYSNMAYYDNKLYTFPSPKDRISEVKYINVPGFYDRGKTKQNKAEAEAVIAEIIRRLRDEKLREDSMGVVTFSLVQQNLIEDMLTESLAKDSNLQMAAEALPEPIFVKNLENVQGDERDIILFSVGYGPDKDGKVGMNFGPLNQDGGWRRLNVAISRARKSMLIYSTLRPEQIDIERTSAEGVRGLKGFLEFAKNGMGEFYTNNSVSEKINNSVAKAIADEISKTGYKTELDVGSSKYHMDIGVINPDDESEYCLGIIVDGENYKRSENANDRNVLQPSVLEGLGWKIIRVYTIDWFDTPAKELNRIKEALISQTQEATETTNVEQTTDIAEDEVIAEVPEESEESEHNQDKKEQ